MEQLDLKKQVSNVATPTNTFESAVIGTPIQSLWPVLRTFNFSKLFPSYVTNFKADPNDAGKVGSHVTVTYKDGSVWTYEIVAISDVQHYITAQVVTATPSLHCTSQQGTLRLYKITENDTTFVTWETDFSNDADAEVIQDNTFKKKDYLKDMKKTFTK